MMSREHSFKGEWFKTLTDEDTGRKIFPAIHKVDGRRGSAYSKTRFKNSIWWLSLASVAQALFLPHCSFGSTDHPEDSKSHRR